MIGESRRAVAAGETAHLMVPVGIDPGVFQTKYEETKAGREESHKGNLRCVHQSELQSTVGSLE
jgi:hypothetical protein